MDDFNQRFLNPHALVSQLALEPGMQVADAGCGTGHLVAELARAVEEDGQVYAIDLDAEMLSSARMYVRQQGLINATFVLGDFLEDRIPEIAPKSLDLILFANLFYVINPEHYHRIPRRAMALLKPGGRIVVVDWKKIPTLFGPPADVRIDEAEMIDFIAAHGFEPDDSVDAGMYHYGLVFRMKPEDGAS
jgi:ubiquinone/menaquinone biosynthesis C-methylase UbiE